jgi:putative ABC transport system ATP-binding protein
MSDAPPERLPAIRVKDLKFSIGEGAGRQQTLYGVNLRVMPGEVVILTGASGHGKSTLLTLIGALRSVEKGCGEIWLGERPLHSLPPKELVQVRRGIGFIFQQHNLLESLTAYENVQLALELTEPSAEVRAQKALDMLKRLEVRWEGGEEERRMDRTYHKPAELSGGLRQRVAIARALVTGPELILADEPTASLDQETGKKATRLICEQANKGATVLFVTHDPNIKKVIREEAKKVRYVKMEYGKIKSDFTQQELDALIDFSQCCTLFKELGTALTDVAEHMGRAEYFNSDIVVQGEPGDKLYLLHHGVVDVIRDGRTIDRRKEGEIFGEMALITPQGEINREVGYRNATCRAVGAVETYTLSKADLKAVLEAHKAVKEQLRQMYAERS